jgi:hypothetical protein
VEILRRFLIANTLKTALLTLISLKHRSSDFKDSLIIFRLRAKQIAPFRNRKGVKRNGPYSTCKFNKHISTYCTYIISKSICPQIQCRQCCVVLQAISNGFCTWHSYLQDNITWLKRQEHFNLYARFYEVLEITWHQPSLRVWILPLNLITSHKAFTPSGPIGL